MAAAGLPLPVAHQERLDFTPRNPDIVAHHPDLGFLFCEVKTNRDRVTEEQKQTLAFLHHLLGAPAEIVRVVPENSDMRSTPLPCDWSLRT